MLVASHRCHAIYLCDWFPIDPISFGFSYRRRRLNELRDCVGYFRGNLHKLNWFDWFQLVLFFFLIYCSKMYRFLYMKINKEVFNNQMFLFDFVKVFANAFLSLYTYFLLHLIQSIVLSWNIELITMCLFQVCFVSTLSTWEAKRY